MMNLKAIAPDVSVGDGGLFGGDPAVLDLVIGSRAGSARPRNVRKHIRRGIDDGALREGEHSHREFSSRQIGAMGNPARYDGSLSRSIISSEKSPSPRIGAMEIPERIEEEFWLSDADTLMDEIEEHVRPRAIAEGAIFGGRVDCYVLDDSRRVISQSGARVTLTGSPPEKGDFERYSSRLPKRFNHLTAPPKIEFDLLSGGLALGVEGAFCVNVCSAYVSALGACEAVLGISRVLRGGLFSTVGHQIQGKSSPPENADLKRYLKRLPDSFHRLAVVPSIEFDPSCWREGRAGKEGAR